MPDGGLFEKIGAAIAAGLLVVYGAVKAIGANRKDQESWDKLKQSVDLLCEISQRNREDESALQRDMGLLMGASQSQGAEITELRIGQGRLEERVDGAINRIEVLEKGQGKSSAATNIRRG